jgi:predicted MPP superfamily phosphohydrolase
MTGACEMTFSNPTGCLLYAKSAYDGATRSTAASSASVSHHSDLAALESRLGSDQARERLRLETVHEARALHRREKNWYAHPALIRLGLRLIGMYGRARRNALRIEVRRNEIVLPNLASEFDGFTLLHLSDLHVDINDSIVTHIAAAVYELEYDMCVLTGDYRAATSGPFEDTLDGMRRICTVLRGPILGVLGNHDSIRMVPALEAMGIRLLLNESLAIERGAAVLQFAGVDDPHYFHADDIERAAAGIDEKRGRTILLAHTPEIYREAAQAGFDLLLCGHTHGGQICLPGGFPITLDARLPRQYGRGAWRYQQMQGYTSVGAGTSIVDARINCPPEVTLHRLRRG